MPHETGIAENVARLRLDRRLTQAALAERAGLSRMALGRIERGDTLPRAGTLTALAEALEVQVRDLVARVRPLRRVRFRAHSTMYGREQILAEVSRWLGDYAWLEGELGESRDFRFREIAANGRPRSPIEAAKAARKVAKVEAGMPVFNICRLLEDCGVKVLLLNRRRDSFFGLSVGPGDGGPAVVVNVWERISVERWIFTAAHELGHLLLHPCEFEREVTEEPAGTEREADRFASEFLMPESAFSQEWKATLGLPLVDRVLIVKRIFRVSYQTVLHRLVQGKHDGAGVWGVFRNQHRNRSGKTLEKRDEPEALDTSEFDWEWGRGGEPAALSKHDFPGNRLSGLVRQAIEDGHISLGRGAEILGISLERMRGWARDWGR